MTRNSLENRDDLGNRRGLFRGDYLGENARFYACYAQRADHRVCGIVDGDVIADRIVWHENLYGFIPQDAACNMGQESLLLAGGLPRTINSGNSSE